MRRVGRSGFAEFKKSLEREKKQDLPWSDLTDRVDKGTLIPIIGNAVMNDQIFYFNAGEEDPGKSSAWSVEEILANEWAGAIDFPLPQQHWMPRVALFDRVVHSADDDAAKERYLKFLKQYFLFNLQKEGAVDENMLAMLWENIDQYSFADTVSLAGYPKPKKAHDSTLDLLAKMNLPLYITTSPFDFLERAIKRHKREKVRTQICFWQAEPGNLREEHQRLNDFDLDPQRPIVYHLFGLEDYADSMVLNEDDYFDFLVRISEESEILPDSLSKEIVRSSLLLLGYSLRDWDFRVMYRGLIYRRLEYKKTYNLAIQLDPRQFIDPDDAKNVIKYLEKYFQDSNFNMKLNSADDFVIELYEKWSQSP